MVGEVIEEVGWGGSRSSRASGHVSLNVKKQKENKNVVTGKSAKEIAQLG